MDFRFSEDEERFRQELGEFLDKELTEEICRQNWEDKGVWAEGREFCRKLAAKGWLGLSWPKDRQPPCGIHRPGNGVRRQSVPPHQT